MIAVVIALAALLLAAVVENMLHQRALKKIPLRILVNGTRGKTTVTRMVAAVLKEAGMRTYAKTTGSEARRILPDGREEEYRREKRPVSMLEQLPFVRLAVKGQAQAIVVECMAQRPENQILIAEKLIRPHYVLMTNAYVDHIEEIGRTEEETVAVLAGSITDECTVIAHDERFGAFTNRLVKPQEEADVSAYAQCPFPVHPDNVRLVMALAQQLGIDASTAQQGILNTTPDIGMYKQVEADGCMVRNAFAANDPVSFGEVLEECAQQGEYALLYNHRSDRSYRVEAFAQVLRACKHPPCEIGVIGESKEWCARYLHRMTGLEAQPVADAQGWIKGRAQVLCAGNIKGEGRSFLEELIKEAQNDV